MKRLACALLVLFPAAAQAIAAGQSDVRLLAVRAEKAPKIDGLMDDAVWTLAPMDDHFTQISPDEGKKPTERTEVRVAYDDRNLYVGVRCFDSDTKGISSRLTRRDRDIETDWLAFFVDSRHDHSSAHVFQLSAAGVQVDGEIVNDSSYTGDWDAVWNGAVATDASGWTAEFEIPLTVLRFSDAPDQTWGFQVLRNVSRKREQSQWTYIPSHTQGQGVPYYGHLEGLHGLHPKRAFELRPYAVARVRAGADEGGRLFGLSEGGRGEASTDVGVDLKLGLTSRLTLDATINPDFGQVEADQVVLNLTRFETFFPEKRPFFLEGREVFETPLTLFYPRRIGRPAIGLRRGDTILDGSGNQLDITDANGALPIWVAAKVSGGLGDRVGLGAMVALTGAERVETLGPNGEERDVDLAPKRGYAALRAKWNVVGNTFIGFMTTAVNRLGGDLYRAAPNHDDYVQALDGRWASTDGKWRLAGQVVASERIGGSAFRDADDRPCPEGAANPDCLPITRTNGQRMGPGDVGYGAYSQLNFSTEHSFMNVTYQSLSPQLDINGMGFLPQYDEHRIIANAAYAQRKPQGPFQKWFIIPFTEHAISWEGVMQESYLGVDTEFQTKGFIFTSPQVFIRFPGTYDDYETFDGAHFERAVNLDVNWVVDTNPANRVYLNVRGYLRKDLNARGRYLGAVAQLRWTALDNFELQLEPEVGFERALRFYDCTTQSGRDCIVDRDQRRYVFADLDSKFVSLIFRATYTFIPTLSLQGYAQLFMDKGTYKNYVETEARGERPFLDREDFVRSAMQIPDGFEDVSLNVNIVLRWEPLPGSTIFGVFTRTQEAPHFNPGKLNRGANEDIFLLKLVYYLS